MKNFSKIVLSLLVLIDILIFYLSIILLVIIRYGINYITLKEHLIAFSLAIPFWIIGFYVNNLYSPFTNKRITLNALKAFLFGSLFSILLFYFNPFLRITPKTNLLIFVMIYFSLFLIFRQIFYTKYLSNYKLRVLVIAPKELHKRILEDFNNLGFLNILAISENLQNINEDCDLILISRKIAPFIDFKKLSLNIPLMEIIEFYEKNLGLIPLEEIDEYWILKEVVNPEHKIQTYLKRLIDLIFSLVLLIFALPLLPFICLGIYLNSPGPLLFKQKRVGKDGRIFTLLKFRTMKEGKDLGIWAKENDERIFFFGKILRRLHLDEIPQIINIFKGELSFIGPRPEQVNIVEELNKKIPFFNIRHIVTPGITGWAQVNYKYVRSLEESKLKLEYDLYYLKNRSLILDLLIFLKTIFNL